MSISDNLVVFCFIVLAFLVKIDNNLVIFPYRSHLSRILSSRLSFPLTPLHMVISMLRFDEVQQMR